MENYSVLMSVYFKDNPEWLDDSIDSMLSQTILTNEFIIIKDGPLTDDLNLIIENYNNKHLGLFNIIELPKNMGLGPALAIGVERARNELLVRMDSDDISRNDRCEILLESLKQHPECGIIGSAIYEFEGSIENIVSSKVFPEKHDKIIRYSYNNNPFAHPAVLFKKSLVLQSGNYQSFYLCEDYDLWIRMFQNGVSAFNCSQKLLYMRVGESFYKRRGGLKYLKSLVKLKTMQHKYGLLPLPNYILSIFIYTVFCIIPNPIRKFLHKKFLRQSA